MSEEHHEMLFDFAPADVPAPTESTTEPTDKGTDTTQGAFDIGMTIPEPFTDEPQDDDGEATDVAEEVLQNPQTAPRRHPNKVSFYQQPEDTARLRGAVLHTMIAEGHRSLSQFVIRAVMKEVQRLEEKYNDGKPFPAVAANEMPQGRPHS